MFLALQIARILLELRQIFPVGDRGRHVPIGIEDDVFHLLGEDRRAVIGLADHERAVWMVFPSRTTFIC